jgi:hypothetical protein
VVITSMSFVIGLQQRGHQQRAAGLRLDFRLRGIRRGGLFDACGPPPASYSSAALVFPHQGLLSAAESQSTRARTMTMPRIGLVALALALMVPVSHPVALAQGVTATSAWYTLAGPERSFTADMPAEPKYTAIEMKTPAGTRYTMHQYLLEQADLAYVVQSAIYPAEINVSNPRVNLQGGLDNAAKSMEGGKWGSVDWTTYQGATAAAATGTRSGNAISSFSVLKGRQIFTLTYAGPAGSAQSPDVERFITSLKIGP